MVKKLLRILAIQSIGTKVKPIEVTVFKTHDTK